MPKIGYYYNSITTVDIRPIREEKKDVVEAMDVIKDERTL